MGDLRVFTRWRKLTGRAERVILGIRGANREQSLIGVAFRPEFRERGGFETDGQTSPDRFRELDARRIRGVLDPARLRFRALPFQRRHRSHAWRAARQAEPGAVRQDCRRRGFAAAGPRRDPGELARSFAAGGRAQRPPRGTNETRDYGRRSRPPPAEPLLQRLLRRIRGRASPSPQAEEPRSAEAQHPSRSPETPEPKRSPSSRPRSM